MMERFASFSPAVAALLSKASFRAPDTVFDDDLTLDLGGVHVRVSGVGPNHTRGDTVMYVEEDRVLFTGDVVMPVFPSASAQAASIEKWLANIAAFEAFAPESSCPRTAGSSMPRNSIRRYREYLTAVQTRHARRNAKASPSKPRKQRSRRRWRSNSAISRRRTERRRRAASTPRSRWPIARRREPPTTIG